MWALLLASAASAFGVIACQQREVPLPPGTIGSVDVPAAEARDRRCGSGLGWALDPAGVSRVEISVDGHRYPARYGLVRPDVAEVKPGYPDSQATPDSSSKARCRPRVRSAASSTSSRSIGRAPNSCSREGVDRAGGAHQWKRCTRARRAEARLSTCCRPRPESRSAALPSSSPSTRRTHRHRQVRGARAHPLPAHDPGRRRRLGVRPGLGRRSPLRRSKDRRRRVVGGDGERDRKAASRVVHFERRGLGRRELRCPAVGRQRSSRAGRRELPMEPAQRGDGGRLSQEPAGLDVGAGAGAFAVVQRVRRGQSPLQAAQPAGGGPGNRRVRARASRSSSSA